LLLWGRLGDATALRGHRGHAAGADRGRRRRRRILEACGWSAVVPEALARRRWRRDPVRALVARARVQPVREECERGQRREPPPPARGREALAGGPDLVPAPVVGARALDLAGRRGDSGIADGPDRATDRPRGAADRYARWHAGTFRHAGVDLGALVDQ